jgi:hypothetical protein
LDVRLRVVLDVLVLLLAAPFRLAPFRVRFAVPALLEALRVVFDLRRRFGTLAPDCRASDRPIATACFRLVTFRPERPERSLPRFISCMARSTFLLALGP